ncbi:FAD dependent oxidoreductase [Bremerella volcania]|uniref:FAD dependent oxidoreductase n=1 Tax=Bremerella volcania TaxID=2527984 RepID=A0A518CBW9_9BACT|nr:FAD dependent oxidoreductase [Bremerella volcania]
MQVATGGSYAISYRSLIPKQGEATNLLVPCCLSSSHIAFGSIRMKPVFMILGQSSATAAALAIDQDIALQDLPYPILKEKLEKDGQQLLPSGAPKQISAQK